MKTLPRIAAALQDLVHAYNRRIMIDAVTRGALGVVFALVTFTVVFGLAREVSRRLGVPGYLGLENWQLAAIVCGLFAIVTTWAAWWRFNPLADVEPPSGKPGVIGELTSRDDRSRFIVAGAVVVLIAGPASVFRAIDLWRSRQRHDPALIEESAGLFTECGEVFPVENAADPNAVVLLQRLRLVKLVPLGESMGVVVTEIGSKLLAKAIRKSGVRP